MNKQCWRSMLLFRHCSRIALSQGPTLLAVCLILAVTSTALAAPKGKPPAKSLPPAPVPQTGQTTSYAPDDDGDLAKGVAWPNPRLIKNVNPTDDTGFGSGIANNGICDGSEICNGTITDKLTGLIWLMNANCPLGTRNWQGALDFVAGINTGINSCGDTSNSGSYQIDWRLPNVRELHSLVDFGGLSRSLILPSDHPFLNFQASFYWSSTTQIGGGGAWPVHFSTGTVDIRNKADLNFVTAVRGGP